MKIKTQQLTGAALDWAVAKAEGALRPLGNVVIEGNRLWIEVAINPLDGVSEDIEYTPSTDWAQAGPIFEASDCLLETNYDDTNCERRVWCSGLTQEKQFQHNPHPCGEYGPTKAIAFCRWYVSSKLGDEVEVPEELRA